MGGSQDALATPQAVLGQAELLGSEDKTVMLFGRENGDTLDYGHGDLLFGEHAPMEVYPRILRWISDRAIARPRAAPRHGQRWRADRRPASRMQARAAGAASPLQPSISTSTPWPHSAHTAPSRLERAVTCPERPPSPGRSPAPPGPASARWRPRWR